MLKFALSRVLNETYLAISYESQCVYFRNYMKRIVLFLLFVDFPENHPAKLPQINYPD